MAAVTPTLHILRFKFKSAEKPFYYDSLKEAEIWMDPPRTHAQPWITDWLEPGSHALPLEYGGDYTNRLQNQLLEEGKMTAGEFKHEQNVHRNIL